MGDRRDHAADALRADLVDRLVEQGTVQSSRVEAALRSVPRERFVPDLDVVRVYEDRAQLVKEGARTTLSTISQPTMVAIMLELSELSAGQRVLEIGTGTGYNAALLGHLVGPTGHVVGVDVEADLVEVARNVLRSLDLDQVEVHAADGRAGWPTGAPYDCVMATVGVESVPSSWREQVVEGGRILVPLLEERTLSVQVRRRDGWETVATSPAAFIPLR